MLDVIEYWCKTPKKLTSAFKNVMKNLANFQKLKNSDFVLESKMSVKIKIKNNQIDQMQYENFILSWK